MNLIKIAKNKILISQRDNLYPVTWDKIQNIWKCDVNLLNVRRCVELAHSGFNISNEDLWQLKSWLNEFEENFELSVLTPSGFAQKFNCIIKPTDDFYSWVLHSNYAPILVISSNRDKWLSYCNDLTVLGVSTSEALFTPTLSVVTEGKVDLKCFGYYSTLIIDEAEKYHNHKLKRFKSMQEYLKLSHNFFFLHGDLLNNPLHAFALVQCLTKNKALGNWQVFVKKFCKGKIDDYGAWDTSGVADKNNLNILLRGGGFYTEWR